MATLRDVATMARVSVATASRVLNGSGTGHPVSPEAKAAVVAAARALGYRPSAAAQALRKRKSNIIGVLASDILDPYFAEMARGIEVAAAEAGFVTVVANANRDPLQERSRFHVLREHQAAGIVFCGSDVEGAPGTAELARDVNIAVNAGTRVVSLAPRSFESTRIVVDNDLASYDLVRHLQGRGHEDIAFLGGLPGLTATEHRIRGYQRAMHEAGSLPRVVGRQGLSQDIGACAMSELLHTGTRPSALVCTNDEVALGALAQAWRSGVDVPGEISVASIGGTRSSSVFDLTTMALPFTELGSLAARFITSTERTPQTPPAPPPILREGRTTAAR